MGQKLTKEDLEKLDSSLLIKLFLNLQDQMEDLQQSIDQLKEQIAIANNQRFGRRSEKLNDIEGQLCMFDEAETLYSPDEEEPPLEETVPRKTRKKRPKGKLEADFKDLPTEKFSHIITDEEADAHFGKNCWNRLEPEVYRKLRFVPSSWLIEEHFVDVIVGRNDTAQDEFMRAKHPKGLLKHSYLTHSLGAAILNGKYTNAMPYDRMEKEFQNYGITISKQTMANWTMLLSEKHLIKLYNLMKEYLLQFPVNQADETPILVLKDGRPTLVKSWMWVHRNSELYRDQQIVLFEFQKGRAHEFPMEFYKDFHGILETDGLQQYHMLEKLVPGITSANCWVHARRPFYDAVKAMKKDDPDKVRQSVAYQALQRIASIFSIEGTLKEMSAEERLRHRQSDIAPLVEEFFDWLKAKKAEHAYLPKSSTGKGVTYFLNQEKYLKVFLSDGNVPIDNSASERSIRPFTLGRKNWLFSNTIRGAQASAVVYSIVESAKANNLRPYYYLDYILEKLPEIVDEDGNTKCDELEKLLPWADEIPARCRKEGR
ncbi:IS66 family transposase [[Clostridium] aminophilum]|uniref:IS66 family transposase n=1 Tax=[Clostridium] aminophilum TaxID=1526 RepID=UPI0033286041